MTRIRFLDTPVDLLAPEELLARAQQAARGGPRLRIEGLNVAKLVDSRNDPALREALEAAEIVHVDGAGIQLGLRLWGIAAPPRRAGIDLMQDLCEQAACHGDPVYLLGARPEIVAAAAGTLDRQHPGIAIAGFQHGYFDEDEEAGVVAAIAASGARYLFIGISSPRKELFLARHWARLGVAVAMGVGGSFDVLAGAIPRAPRAWQRAGMEWLFRLLQEPRRLAGRYLRTNLCYLALLLGAAPGLLRRRHTSRAGRAARGPRT